MQTRALKTLLEIERVGSFVAAAEHLNMTLSAVSMQMKTLEQELDAELFDRSHRPPKLTPVGRSVASAAARVVGAEADLVAQCRPTDKLKGAFRIGFVPTASIRLLPGFLQAARDHAPDARFDIETGLSEALEDRLLAGWLDCAVLTASKTRTKGLSYHLLREERLVYVAPVEAADLSVDQLFAELPFFHFLPQSGIGKLIATYVSGHERAPHSSVYLDSVEAIMECVNAGLGFTLLPEPDITRHVGVRSLVVEPDGAAPSRRLVLATARRGTVVPQIDRIAALFAPPPQANASPP